MEQSSNLFAMFFNRISSLQITIFPGLVLANFDADFEAFCNNKLQFPIILPIPKDKERLWLRLFLSISTLIQFNSKGSFISLNNIIGELFVCPQKVNPIQNIHFLSFSTCRQFEHSCKQIEKKNTSEKIIEKKHTFFRHCRIRISMQISMLLAIIKTNFSYVFQFQNDKERLCSCFCIQLSQSR